MSIRGLYETKPWRFILTVLFYILIPLTAIGQSYLLMYEITALSNHQFSLWLLLTLAESIVLLITGISQALSNYLATKQIQEYNHQIRNNIVNHYYYDKNDHKTSAMQNRLTTDLRNVDENYLTLFFKSIQMIFYILFSIVVLLSIHWSLLLVTLILVVISIFLPNLLMKPMQKAFSNISDSNKKYLDTAEKWLSGLNVLQRYLAGGKLYKTMNAAAKEVENSKVQQTKVNQELTVMNGLISNLLMLALFTFTAILISKKIIIFGTITTVGNLQFYMSTGLQSLGNYRGQIQSTTPLNKQIENDSKIIKVNNNTHNNVATAIKIQDLSISFPNGESIKYPNFSVNSGEKVLLSGDSGTGKSTLLKLILKELKPTTGKITYFNNKGIEIRPDTSKIGYIAQEPTIFPDTIQNNITMFDHNLDNQVNNIIMQVNLHDDVAKFKKGIQQKINTDQLNISGGQRQKIVLARAKIHNSDIILIDEGTSAIDQKTTTEILKNLVNTNITLIFIAHNFSKELHNMFDKEIRL